MDSQQENFWAFFQKNFLGFSILISAVLIAGALFYAKPPKDFGRPGDIGTASLEDIVGSADLPALGNASAKVTIVEFGDYQCPFCGKFFHETEPKIREAYVNTGKVKFIWRDFAFLGEESFLAAEAARCANEQSKFWEYHDVLFAKQNGENQGAFKKENLQSFAQELGLDQAKFSSCLDSGKYRNAVMQDSRKASNLGVNSAPTVFINTRKVVGALPFESFQEIIEAELRK